MVAFIASLGSQISTSLKNLHDYFKSSPISTGFFFLFIVAALNIFKAVLICLEKKKGYPDQACRYLFPGRHGPVCKLPSYEQGFKDRKNSCEGCSGKTFSITNEEVTERTAASAKWKRIIILLASYSKGVLPYVSFLYTLFIAIFEKKT